MTTSILTTAALLVSSLAAAFVLTGPEAAWVDGAGAMIAISHIILTSVTVVAALVGAARWSVGVGVALASALMLAAVLHPIDPAWVVMVGAAGLALVGLLGTRLSGAVRLRPSAAGPPRKAVALVLGLLSIPLVVGLVQPGGVDLADWLVAAAAVVLGVWYSRARPTALWAVRVLLPLLTVACVLVVPLPAAVGVIAAFGVMSWLAWSTDARVAVIPLSAPGRRVPIPPELTPGEILDAAGLDARGRRKEAE